MCELISNITFVTSCKLEEKHWTLKEYPFALIFKESLKMIKEAFQDRQKTKRSRMGKEPAEKSTKKYVPPVIFDDTGHSTTLMDEFNKISGEKKHRTYHWWTLEM
ncbi:hypothetical protein CDAR_365101 [Caerostris darwini]|uniref:Uncharacterized protein n=1 Tax=Caerostris darwini TaxID=1538125 RepID=A0AAV4U1F1_9ARAC|nr:hypothetical protein CDAR_365101 [Caerostris darwini]